MIRPTMLLRLLAKTVLWTLITVATFVGIWFVANRSLDETPAEDRVAFLRSSEYQIPDRQNIAVGMLGLTAPSGKDFMEHGATMKALYEADAPYERIQEIMRGAESLQPTVKFDQIRCWLYPHESPNEDCLPFDKVPEILRQNNELLERFLTLQRLEGYSTLFTIYNPAFLVLLRLNLADIQLDLQRGDYEKAYEKWRDQLQFSRTMLRGQDTWFGKAIALVVFGFTLPFIEEILLARPELAKSRVAELTTLLRPEGINEFNMEGIVRAEYHELARSFARPPLSFGEWSDSRAYWLAFYLGQKERILNRYYIFSRDFADSLLSPWSQIESERTRLSDEYTFISTRDAVIDPFGSLFLVMYIEGELQAQVLYRSMFVTEGRLRLGTLLIRIIVNDIGDDEIPTLLATVGPEYYDPMTNTPMKWDQDGKKIYFPDPQNECVPYASFQIPGRKKHKTEANRSTEKGVC